MRNQPLFPIIAVNSVLQALLLTCLTQCMVGARCNNLDHRAHHGLTNRSIQKINCQNKSIILYFQVEVIPITPKSLNYA